jgi:hypothetical protein
MKLKSFFLFIFILFFAASVLAQNSLKTLGKVFVEVKGGEIDFSSPTDFAIIPPWANNSVYFAISIKEKLPLFIGGTQKIFFCAHCVNYKISTSVFKKFEDYFVRIHVQSDKPEYFQKVIKLRKGETTFGEIKTGLAFWVRFDDITN